ncbi:MAG: DNA glycosylase AlkZ-like family protein, partial [Vicinamibacterales bacterium]
EGLEWYWPTDETIDAVTPAEAVRFLAPFDAVVWDRRRFELLWGWPYRFEAYTPVTKRVRGYYALPLLWRERVIGWGNVAVNHGALRVELGYVSGRPPRERRFRQSLDEELERLRLFLDLRLPAS